MKQATDSDKDIIFWKKYRMEALKEVEPLPLDETLLGLIENGKEELTDDLFFKLIKESPAYLSAKPFLSRISQWQYIIDNPLFEKEDQEKAKKNLLKIGKVLAYEGQGRPTKADPTVIYLKFKQLRDWIAAYLAARPYLEAGSILKTFLTDNPGYADCFDLKGQRRSTSPKEIAIRILMKRANCSERTIRAAISENTPTRK